MRNRILGLIGVVWGGFILLNRNSQNVAPTGDRAYDAGLKIGLVFGILLLVSGLYYLIVGDEPLGSVLKSFKKKKKKKKKAVFPRPTSSEL